MELGQPDDLKKAASFSGITNLKITEGENIHRVLFGPVKVDSIYYPTLITDRETGELKQIAKVIKRPPAGCTLDALASFEKRVRTAKGEKDPKSSLSPTSRWLYLVFHKNGENPLEIQVAQYPWTIFKGLKENEESRSTNDNTKLRHGLIFMYNVIITKTVDPNKPRRFGTSYKVEVDPENKYTGKVPASYLGKTVSQLSSKGFKLSNFFSDEEWEAIDNSKVDLRAFGIPNSEEEINAMLTEFPLFLGAKDENDNYKFTRLEEFAQQMDSLNIEYLKVDANRPKELPGAGEKPEEETTVETEKETIVEELPEVEVEIEKEVIPEVKGKTEDAEFKELDDTVKNEPSTSEEEFPEW